MRKFVLILFLSIFTITGIVYATNVKWTAMPADTTPISTDIMVTVDDPGGTPISKKVTLANLFGSTANIGASTIVTTGALNSGSITSGFTSIDIGAGPISTTGTISGASGTWDVGGMDIATTDTYAIAGTNVIDNATTLSSGMVTSSLTAVGALNTGSITSGFTSINVGSGVITTTGIITGGNSVLTTGTLTVADGGIITQGAGSGKATTVILNTNSGQITTDNASLAGGAEVTFTVTNSKVTALDVIMLSIADSPDADSEVIVFVNDVTSGAFDILLSNVSGNADTGAIVINFVVLRGASS